LQFPDRAQRHQTLFGLGALFALVTCFGSASGLFRPAPEVAGVGPLFRTQIENVHRIGNCANPLTHSDLRKMK
jgi:hypothetical protein